MADLISPDDHATIATRLKAGQVAVLPTDTVYGLVACAADTTAVQRLYALKAREHKPGTIIAASLQQLIDLGIRARYLKAVEQYWPNSISVVVPCGEELTYLHQGVRSLAVRIPSDEHIRSLLKETGALLTSSANQPGEPVATTILEAQAYFPKGVDFFVDGGQLKDRPPSTVLRIVDDAVEVLRRGAVQIDANGSIVL